MGQVVGRDHQGPPLAAELLEQFDHQLLGADVHAIEGLIQQHHRSALGEGAGQEGPLALTAGEGADLAMAQRPEIDPLKGLPHGLLVGRARDPQQIHGAIAPHHHHLVDVDREVPVDTLGLGDIGHGLGAAPAAGAGR